MKHKDLIQLVEDFRTYLRCQHAAWLKERRFGVSHNHRTGTADLLLIKLLQKLLDANLRKELTDPIALPNWISTVQFNQLVSNVKTVMRNGHQ